MAVVQIQPINPVTEFAAGGGIFIALRIQRHDFLAEDFGLDRGVITGLGDMAVDELGLSAALNSLVAGWNARSGGKTHYRLTIDGDPDRLPEPVPANIFRIIQECLTNIAKHSTAANAQVTLTQSEGLVELRVDDDGSAGNPPYEDAAGIGLLGMSASGFQPVPCFRANR